MWRCNDLLLNCVRTQTCRKPPLRQLLSAAPALFQQCCSMPKRLRRELGCERNSWLWLGQGEGPPADPIDFLTASSIQGCWISINRAKDQTMKGCVESPKDLGKGRKQSSRSPRIHERFWHYCNLPICQYPLQKPAIEHSSKDLCVRNLIAWERSKFPTKFTG